MCLLLGKHNHSYWQKTRWFVTALPISIWFSSLLTTVLFLWRVVIIWLSFSSFPSLLSDPWCLFPLSWKWPVAHNSVERKQIHLVLDKVVLVQKSWYFEPRSQANWKTLGTSDKGLLMVAKLSHEDLNFLMCSSRHWEPLLSVKRVSQSFFTFLSVRQRLLLQHSPDLYGCIVPITMLRTSSVILQRSQDIKISPSLFIKVIKWGFSVIFRTRPCIMSCS